MVELYKWEYIVDVSISRADWQVLGYQINLIFALPFAPRHHRAWSNHFNILKAFETATLICPGNGFET
jgi:hypothetical protein